MDIGKLFTSFLGKGSQGKVRFEGFVTSDSQKGYGCKNGKRRWKHISTCKTKKRKPLNHYGCNKVQIKLSKLIKPKRQSYKIKILNHIKLVAKTSNAGEKCKLINFVQNRN